MKLNEKAKELLEVLDAIACGLETYSKEHGKSYTIEMAKRFRPLVEDYREAVLKWNSRKEAEKALQPIKEIMHNINGAATKGDIYFVSGNVLGSCWRLCTIFQETEYKNEEL